MQHIISNADLTSANSNGRNRPSTRILRARRDRRKRSKYQINSGPPLHVARSRQRRYAANTFPYAGAFQERAALDSVRLNASSSRALEQAWLKEHQAEYVGQWVALQGASLVAHGSAARDVLDSAAKKGYIQPLLAHISNDQLLPFGGW